MSLGIAENQGVFLVGSGYSRLKSPALTSFRDSFYPLFSKSATNALQAHIKSALIGASVNVPITNGRLATGTWQGIWYLEFRTSRHSRKVVATIQGQKA